MTVAYPNHDTLAAEGWRPKAPPGFVGLIGPLWVRKEQGAWAYGLLANENHLNPMKVVHGGLLLSLMDHAISAVGWEALERRACVTVQLDAQFLAPAREGQFMEARARVVRVTSSLVFMQGQISAGGTDVLSASALLKVVADPGTDPVRRQPPDAHPLPAPTSPIPMIPGDTPT